MSPGFIHHGLLLAILYLTLNAAVLARPLSFYYLLTESQDLNPAVIKTVVQQELLWGQGGGFWRIFFKTKNGEKKGPKQKKNF